MARTPSLRFYVGITESPVLRWLEHADALRRPAVQSMTVVEVARSSTTTAASERAIIAAASAAHGHACLNIDAGGGGASAGSPHYVYVCWTA